jgi:CAAX protease family protein
MQQLPGTGTTLLAILSIEAFALVLRAALQLELQEHGLSGSYAADLGYLIVPPVVFLLLLPLLRLRRESLLRALDPRSIGLRAILAAAVVGLLARLAWWCTVVMRVALGLVAGPGPAFGTGLQLRWSCPPATQLALALLVWVVLVPVVEEIVNRGLVQASLQPRGRWFAIVLSALLFAACHNPPAMPFALAMGIVFGVQFANSRSLWSTIVSHAAYDGAVLFDWRCLRSSWTVATPDLPLMAPATIAGAGLLLCTAAIFALIRLERPGTQDAPRA